MATTAEAIAASSSVTVPTTLIVETSQVLIPITTGLAIIWTSGEESPTVTSAHGSSTSSSNSGSSSVTDSISTSISTSISISTSVSVSVSTSETVSATTESVSQTVTSEVPTTSSAGAAALYNGRYSAPNAGIVCFALMAGCFAMGMAGLARHF